MVRLQKRFTDSQVKGLIERYLNKEIESGYIQEALGACSCGCGVVDGLLVFLVHGKTTGSGRCCDECWCDLVITGEADA